MKNFVQKSPITKIALHQIDVLTICLHRSAKGGRKNWVLDFGLGCRPPFAPGEAGRSALRVNTNNRIVKCSAFPGFKRRETYA
jgi:hypothetical protein